MSTGFAALLAGDAQIGMSSRRVKQAEVVAFRGGGLGDPLNIRQEMVIAVDGLLIVVHPSNPLTALQNVDVSSLLSGKIDNWSELGGPDLPVQVFSRNSNSGIYSTIKGQFLTPFQADLSADANIVAGNVEMAAAVFSNPGLIGYVGLGFVGKLFTIH